MTSSRHQDSSMPERLAAPGELETLRERLREAEETLQAIRHGDVDAVIVTDANDVPRVYTLETADQTYRRLVEEMQEGALTLSREGDVLYCNRRLAELVDTVPEHVIGSTFSRFVVAADWSTVLEMIRTESKGEIGIQTERGMVVPTHVSFSALRADDLREDIFCCIVTDLTEQRRTGDELRRAHAALLLQVAEREKTEQMLRHSQKMEAIGQLTGGIAHDFNNLLMVITGGLSILDRNPAPDRRQKLRDGMRQAAERGAALTRQLLAFSRQKELRAKPIDIPRHVEGMRELLDGSLGGAVTVATAFEPDVWAVRADEAELGIALLNLCVNARDAMAQGGIVTIAACNCADLNEHGLVGDFVAVSVADTGEGMSSETVARCLEPFYTTKDIGRGSGLGLAQVYGFAHGSGGLVQIDSKVGEGTRVRLFLPRSKMPSQPDGDGVDSRPGVAAIRQSSSHVLLVEDDVSVASLTAEMLVELGYTVNAVANAKAALIELRKAPDVDLVLSDVMMPGGMDGLALAKEMRMRGSKLPIILVSGFAAAIEREAQAEGILLLPKPYTLSDLGAALHSAFAASETMSSVS